MANISGRLIFDSARTAVASTALPGIANVPIVLQNVNSGAMLAVLTDANGNYLFTNVPNGNYQIVEYYGMTPVIPTPGDFSTATVGSIISGGIVPPLSYAPAATVPIGATNLDCVTPNTLLLTITGSDFFNQNILNGPVRYTPIDTIIDSHAVVLPDNLITDADYGTFGSWQPGMAATSVASANPYPGIGSGFTYVQSSWPSDGQFSIMNIDNYGYSSWWHFTDHTSGNETGRMMVVNGYNPGAIIFEETVSVKPNTYYLFTTWILNALKLTGQANPALGVQVLDQNGQIIIDETLGQRIPVNTHTPEWVEIGSVIYSEFNTQLTFKFISQGPEADGNDYVIDDIGLYEMSMVPPLIPVKTSNAQSANIGDIVTYTVALTNIYDRAITNVMFYDLVPSGLQFVPNSVMVNGSLQPMADPNVGFALPDVPGGETITISFSAKVIGFPPVNPTLNTARITFDYTIVEGGLPTPNETESNEVPLLIKKPKPEKPCLCRTPITKCRMNIKGKKTWIDNNDMNKIRPDSVEVILLRDGEIYERKIVDSNSDWTFCFGCLPIWKNSDQKYKYEIDELDVHGYAKTIKKYNIINKLI